MSPRTSAGRLARIRSRLSERDLAILADVQRVRLLTARQIERLHFRGGSSQASAARRSRRVLKRLHEGGLLTRLDRRVGGVYAGSAGFIYTLSSLGQQLLSSTGPAGGSRRRSPWEPSAHFVDHILDVAELYVLLREHEQREERFTMTRFEGEPAAWRSWIGLAGERAVLKPDAFVAITSADAQGSYEQLSFVEVDRGTEHRPTIAQKLRVYVEAYRAGVEQENGASYPNVVWIVPDDKRAELIRREINRLDRTDHSSGGLAHLFVVTTNEPINQVNVIEGGEA